MTDDDQARFRYEKQMISLLHLVAILLCLMVAGSTVVGTIAITQNYWLQRSYVETQRLLRSEADKAATRAGEDLDVDDYPLLDVDA